MWTRRGLLRILVTALALLCSAARVTGAVDLTHVYLNAFRSDCAFGAAHVQALRMHKVLLVPGYFGDLDPNYFADQLRWLTSIGVEREKVAVRARESVAVNAPIIATAIRNSVKPVILITHSKGSVDTLAALQAEPLLRTKVKGWISLQGAFFGSPVADMLLGGSRIDPLISIIILGYFGGTRESAQGLTTDASRAYYRDHKSAIDRVVRDVPAIAFASVLDAVPGAPPNTSLAIPRDLMAREGLRSDGLLPLDAAVLPDMDFVRVAGVDHIAPVMPAVQRFDRVRMTQALLLGLRSPLRDLPRDAGCKEWR
jgi:hypothetical protein